MKIFEAEKYNIRENEDNAEAFEKLFSIIKNTSGEKILRFNRGVYKINSENLTSRKLFITNTAGDKEYSENETPHLQKTALFFNGTKNLTVEGNGAVILISGNTTNIAITDCENIHIDNLEIKHIHPDLHAIKVIKKGGNFIDFALDADTLCKEINSSPHFYGPDYCYKVTAHQNNGYIGLIKPDTPDKVERVRHPFYSSTDVRLLPDGSLRAYYESVPDFSVGSEFYDYCVRRDTAGIFIDKSENIRLTNIAQRYNKSLALVAQDSENIYIDKVEFSPEKGCPRKLCSLADFFQFCMCRGKIAVTDSYFDGAGDDCLNVHGVHYRIKNIDGNTITVSYCHDQTHGFNPLRKGDKIAFIDTETLLEKGTACILDSRMLSEYDIELILDNTQGLSPDDAIEDISAIPEEFVFSGNTMTRIITRGLLITMRGRAIVENNRFVSTTASGILLSDDANFWFESGMCHNVTIRNNIFDYCGETPIRILPENKKHRGAVHKNITVEGNTFISHPPILVTAKSTDNITLSGNIYSDAELIETVDCTNISIL